MKQFEIIIFLRVLTWICTRQDVGQEFRSGWDCKMDTERLKSLCPGALMEEDEQGGWIFTP